MQQKKKIQTFFIESLGCAKNTVDSQSMEKLLSRSGYRPVAESKNADVIVVNTCGFIQPAKEESLQVLNQYAEEKSSNQYLIAAGCLSEREKDTLVQEVPELDAALSTRRWVDILQVFHLLDAGTASPYLHFPDTTRIQPNPEGIPAFAVQCKSAYLKTADGCDRKCAYCAIPMIKGPMVSRMERDIIRDALLLQEKDIKEVILIAQDSTVYGRDLGKKDALPDLLEALVAQVPGIPWIRIMYMFPDSISDRLIEMMSNHQQILPYLDIPLQHAHPNVLKRMRRPSDMKNVRDTLSKMRTDMPDLALRTTFIVGFPGETQDEFQTLLEFVQEIEFDHVGIFPYYHEQGTSAFDLEDDIPESIKQERIQALACVQEDVSLRKNQAFIEKELMILIEGNGDGMSIGRSYRDAPEIDGLVFLQQVITPGTLLKARITGALVHDLIGIAN